MPMSDPLDDLEYCWDVLQTTQQVQPEEDTAESVVEYSIGKLPHIRLRQIPHKGVAFYVWNCSVALARYMSDGIHAESPGHFVGKKVIELGAGTGLAGIAAARLGASVTLTDLADVVPLLEENIALNAIESNATAAALPWGEPCPHISSGFDYIIAADVIYLEHLFEPLLRTLLHLSSDSASESDRPTMRPSPPSNHAAHLLSTERPATQAPSDSDTPAPPSLPFNHAPGPSGTWAPPGQALPSHRRKPTCGPSDSDPDPPELPSVPSRPEAGPSSTCPSANDDRPLSSSPSTNHSARFPANQDEAPTTTTTPSPGAPPANPNRSTRTPSGVPPANGKLPSLLTGPQVLLAYQKRRRADKHFFQKAAKHFLISPIQDAVPPAPDGKPQPITIYRMALKSRQR